MKKKSLLLRIIIRLTALGLVILIGAGTAAGVQLYQQSMEFHRDIAFSYVSQMVTYLDTDRIEEMLRNRDQFLGGFTKDTASGETGPEASAAPGTAGNLSADEVSELVGYWCKTLQLFMSAVPWHDDFHINSFYVAIPAEEGLEFIWGVDSSAGALVMPFERQGYMRHEEEALMKIMSGEQSESFTVYHEGETLGTAAMGIWNREGKNIAVAAMDISLSDITDSIRTLILNLAAVLVLIMAAGCLVYYLIQKKTIINPLLSMKEASSGLVDRLKQGEKEPVRLNIRTGDEIEELSHAMEDMGQSLQAYIRESEAVAAEKEQAATEMRLAARIQADMLPDIAARVPAESGVDLCASMDPAKAVGGDFYDCFFIDEDHLALVIADVSGKGVPAALFMSMSSMLLRFFCTPGASPAEILQKVNERILEYNRNMMFVTVWLGILDLKTGLLRTANAGHEYPALKNPDGTFDLVRDPHGLVVGAMKGIRIRDFEIQLSPGSMLFVYTDGVPEATGPDGKRFETRRMLETLRAVRDESPKQVLDAMKAAVSGFVRDAEQFDDLTMMCLRFRGRDGEEAGDPAGEK